MMMLDVTVMSVTETGMKFIMSRRNYINSVRERWGEYECHYSCQDCDPATSCKEGMTCYNDHLFTEFLIQTLLTELNVDPTRVHASGLSNGAGGKPSPQFDTPHLDNHTVQLGAIAFLPCTIKNLGNRSSLSDKPTLSTYYFITSGIENPLYFYLDT